MAVWEGPRAGSTGGRLMLTDISPYTELPIRIAIALIALLLVTVAEVLTTYGDPRSGIGMHIVLLALCLGLGALVADPRFHTFFLTLAIAPIIRIVSTGMPLHAFPQVYWYLLTSIPLFIAAFSIAQASGLAPRALNLRLPARRDLPIEAAVWASGLGLGYVEWRILGADPLVASHPLSGLIGAALVLLICTGFVEELIFRGVVQSSAGALLGPKAGILFSAGLFAVLHIGHRSVLDVLFVAAVGLYFSLVVRHTRSLLGVTLAHGTINIMLFIALPLAVSDHPGNRPGPLLAAGPIRLIAAIRTQIPPAPTVRAAIAPPHRTPTPAATPSSVPPSPTPSATRTQTPPSATATASASPTATPSSVPPSPTPTDTRTPAPPTATATHTPLPSATPTRTPALPTATATATATPVRSRRPGLIAIIQPLALSTRRVGAGGSVTASVTLRNAGDQFLNLQDIVIAGRPPGGTDANGPFDDFGQTGRIALQPGQSLTIRRARRFGAPDPAGTWYAFVTYQTPDGRWHDDPRRAHFSLHG